MPFQCGIIPLQRRIIGVLCRITQVLCGVIPFGWFGFHVLSEPIDAE